MLRVPAPAREAAPEAPVPTGVPLSSPQSVAVLLPLQAAAAALRVLAPPPPPLPFVSVRSAHERGRQLPTGVRLTVQRLPVGDRLVRTEVLRRSGDGVYLGGVVPSAWSSGPVLQWHVLEASGATPMADGPANSRLWARASHVAGNVAALLTAGGRAVQFVDLGDAHAVEVPLEDEDTVTSILAVGAHMALAVAQRIVLDDKAGDPFANARTEHHVLWVDAKHVAPTRINATSLVLIGHSLVVAFDRDARSKQDPQLLQLGETGVRRVTRLVGAQGFVINSLVVMPTGELATYECRAGEERVSIYSVDVATGALVHEASSTALSGGFAGDWRLVADSEGCVLADTGGQLLAFRREGQELHRVAACPFRNAVQPVMSAARVVVGQSGDGTFCAVRFDGEQLERVPVAGVNDMFMESMLVPLPDGRLLGTAPGGQQLVLIDVS